MKGPDAAAREFIDLFERLGVPYAVMGGLAVRLHALPRPTFDVDFMAAIPRDGLLALFDSAEGLGFAVPEAQRSGWVDDVHGLPVVKFQWLLEDRTIDVDVFIAECDFQREILKRRQRHSGAGWEGWFVTAEDLILLKLLADRPKDRADIADILVIQGKLDEAYLRLWAERLGVTEGLESVLRQAEA